MLSRMGILKKNDKILKTKTEDSPLGFFQSNLLIKILVIFLGSGAFTGFFPFAPGSFASLITLLFLYFSNASNPVFLFIFSTILFFVGVFICFILEKMWGKDPSRIVVDEVVGMSFSLIFLPKTYLIWGTAFLTFRFFDIVKPYPLKKFEKFKGGWGIMMDDIGAGIYTLIFVNIFIRLFGLV